MQIQRIQNRNLVRIQITHPQITPNHKQTPRRTQFRIHLLLLKRIRIQTQYLPAVVDTQKQIITHNQPRLQNIANGLIVRLLVNTAQHLRLSRIRLHQIQTRIRPHKIALTQNSNPLPSLGKILLVWNNNIIRAARKSQHQQTFKMDESQSHRFTITLDSLPLKVVADMEYTPAGQDLLLI